MSAVQWLLPTAPAMALAERQAPWAFRLGRAAVLCLLFSVPFLPEFAHTSTDTISPLYDKAAGSFRHIDLALLTVAALHVLALGCLRHKRVRFPRALALPGAAFLGCIAVAIFYGARHGGSKFFFDWRGLALGIALFFVWSFWLQCADDVAAAARVFLCYAGIRILIIFVMYLFGQRDTLLNVTIPVFDGPELSAIVFTGLLAFALLDKARDACGKLLLAALMFAAYLLVLICLRRTYWGELAIGTTILLSLRTRNRARSFALAAGALLIAAVILGSSFSGRVQSLDVTREDTEFSADNADHVHDLVDAWYQVRQSPVMGIGLGTSYSTWHIRNWKQESVMVHNAPLHVWLKYGIAGLAFYLWFHLALLRWLFRQSRATCGADTPVLSAAFAYLTAQFAMTLGFAPWPYSEVQLTTLMSFLLAAACGIPKSAFVLEPNL
jgi:O-Antigen ligase